MKFKPIDLLVWLGRIDVNGLSDVEAERLARINFGPGIGYKSLFSDWLRPWFNKNNQQNKIELICILKESRNWSDKAINNLFSSIRLPSDKQIINPLEFMNCLRNEFDA